ncbi:ParB/RepB/Spo0J family partition protein [Sandaracinobacter sp. RS1-74]|uniref:ParB/RepB/Spo0J family partition protein n=1 Tax=Sandaracinobacteroides sayramensis TaxID=2913411 RepID=UPI001EDBB830|nr:ParB/RepB/Spo0J family partition protein [Sandaracinobacteroides sayramensis]MCG2841853.1 ParB/RepB/Spo0J family partition protein [Sandaracinobacteroides sayramensis]
MAVKKGGLGRGLSALLEEMGSAAPGADPKAGASSLPVGMIDANPRQPRRHFDEVALNELADSIRIKGVLQPILVRPATEGRYEIVAGERRWRASQIAGLHEIPVVIRPFSEADGYEAAIIENVQRADLNPMEEAEGYHRLVKEYSHTQEMVAAVTGKARSHVGNLLRLLDLPDDAQALVKMGLLSVGHAKAVLQAKEPASLAKEIAARGLTVRQAEEAARKSHNAPAPKLAKSAPAQRDADLEMLESQISETLGLQVAIEARGKRGTVTIKFSDLDQLDRVIERLQG